MNSADERLLRLGTLLTARRFDETLLRYPHLSLPTALPSVGRESTSSAVAACREEFDALLLTHRNHHYLSACGADPEVLFAEIFGRGHGFQKGRGGTLNVMNAAAGVIWTSAILGGSLALSLGVALARKRQGSGIVFSPFGDGSISEGIATETFNLAVLNQLPIVFICERNEQPEEGVSDIMLSALGMRDSAARNLTDIPAAYQMPTCIVDATRPLETYEVVRSAVDEVRAGGGPRFIEARSLTPVWMTDLEHAFIPSEPVDTRLEAARTAPAELDSWSRADPVINEVRALLDAGVDMDRILQIDGDVRAELERAAASAAEAPIAPVSVALDDVWESAR